MNRVQLSGRLTADPETRTTQSGIPQCSFRIAVQRRNKNTDGTRDADFINIITWRNTAESCAKFLAKGLRVIVEGAIQTRSYTAQDGTKRFVTEIIAEHVEFIDWKTETAGADAAPPAQRTDGFADIDDDELPF